MQYCFRVRRSVRCRVVKKNTRKNDERTGNGRARVAFECLNVPARHVYNTVVHTRIVPRTRRVRGRPSARNLLRATIYTVPIQRIYRAKRNDRNQHNDVACTSFVHGRVCTYAC